VHLPGASLHFLKSFGALIYTMRADSRQTHPHRGNAKWLSVEVPGFPDMAKLVHGEPRLSRSEPTPSLLFRQGSVFEMERRRGQGSFKALGRRFDQFFPCQNVDHVGYTSFNRLRVDKNRCTS
jgi:hypothetical protein